MLSVQQDRQGLLGLVNLIDKVRADLVKEIDNHDKQITIKSQTRRNPTTGIVEPLGPYAEPSEEDMKRDGTN